MQPTIKDSLPLTSVHDAFAVHVLERAADLCEVLPNGPLGDESLLSPEVADHTVQVPGVGHLQNYVQLVIFNERGQVLDDVRVIQLLKYRVAHVKPPI